MSEPKFQVGQEVYWAGTKVKGRIKETYLLGGQFAHIIEDNPFLEFDRLPPYLERFLEPVVARPNRTSNSTIDQKQLAEVLREAIRRVMDYDKCTDFDIDGLCAVAGLAADRLESCGQTRVLRTA